MNWAKENKFLTGYIVVMVIGVGALGFKVFTASGALDDANARYAAQASSYDSLRRVVPYPDRDTLAKYEAQKKEAADVITDFQKELTKREFPPEAITPEQFQDRLKKAVTEAREKAKAANIDLGEKFYLGFDRYETTPPDKDATAALARELKAIEWVVDQFLSAPIAKLNKLERPEMPEEKGKGGGNRSAGGQGNRPGGPGGGQGGPGGGGRNHADLVTNHPFNILVTCKQRQFSNALNSLINPKAPQFLIPRSIRVNNQNPKGPPRVDPNATPADPTAPPAGAGADTLKYIVGEELIEAALTIEIVDFADPATPPAK